MNKKTKNNILIFSALAVAIFFLAGGGQLFSVAQIPISYLPYGESDSVITGLNQVSSNEYLIGSGSSAVNCLDKVYSSTYWDATLTNCGAPFNGGNTDIPRNGLFTGNDFDLTFLPNNGQRPPTSLIIK